MLWTAVGKRLYPNELLVRVSLSKTFANSLNMQKQFEKMLGKRVMKHTRYRWEYIPQKTTFWFIFYHNINVVETLIYHGKLANQIARLAAIVVNIRLDVVASWEPKLSDLVSSSIPKRTGKKPGPQRYRPSRQAHERSVQDLEAPPAEYQFPEQEKFSIKWLLGSKITTCYRCKFKFRYTPSDTLRHSFMS